METDLTPTRDRQLVHGTLPDPIVTAPTALDAMTRTELDVQISAARRNPRSLAHFRQQVLSMIKLDAATAASCFYAIPRKQRQDDGTMRTTTISGPSIRLAELAAAAWRNIRAGARIVAEGRDEVTALGFCHDLEANHIEVVQVDRRIVDRNGNRYSDDLVTVTKNAACAIARRNAIFAVVPRAFIDPLVDVAMKTARGDARTVADARKRLLKSYAELGVTAGQVCDKVERAGVDDLDLEDLTLLNGLLTAIQERETSVAVEFPRATDTKDAPGSRTAAVRDTVRRRREAADAAAARSGAPAADQPAASDQPAPTTEDPPA